MKPNYTTTAYFNTRYWEHKTDSKGWRNEIERDKADIILLGDSFIYGHGVNFNQTVGYFIEKYSNYSVVNLGQQGVTSFHEMYFLENFGFNYSPKYVLYFFYSNDLPDLNFYFTDEALRTFVNDSGDKVISPDKNICVPGFFKRGLFITRLIKYFRTIICFFHSCIHGWFTSTPTLIGKSRVRNPTEAKPSMPPVY